MRVAEGTCNGNILNRPVLIRVLLAFMCLSGSAWAVSSWQRAVTPGPSGSMMNGVWGSGPSDVFVVGEGGTIMHYDGTAWSLMTSGTTAELFGVWGTAPNNVYAAGAGGIILAYNGSTWSDVSIQNDVHETLNWVWGSGPADVWAVGGTANPPAPDQAARFDGAKWSVARIPLVGYNGEISLSGLWGTSAGDIYAVGNVYTGVDGITDALIVHYDGTAWTEMPSATDLPLFDVWGSGPNDIFACGKGGIVHYDGTTWSLMYHATTYWLEGLWGSAANNVYAVGGYGAAGARILHYDGNSWSEVYNHGSPDANLRSIWGSGPDNIYATTSNGDQVLHYAALPTASITAPAANAAAGRNPLIFAVQLSKLVDWEVTLKYAASDGTAVAGSDYTAASGTLTIPPGQTTGTISVTTGTNASDTDKTFTVTLSDPLGTTLETTQATGTIPGTGVSPTPSPGPCGTAPLLALFAAAFLLLAGVRSSKET